ncbi:solute carrier family 23 member 1-like isoform X1 [Mercenaria mercenaria]|uniref:solute carrier family 23 member 1-like isoform X1 n=1 Tax=Mercenaria mercenaria TaxID=6596 RepID=UPI00234EDDDD|nr:solute carrier family 23 member 1-like isoform X1 [Mercenaria mercenaria]
MDGNKMSEENHTEQDKTDILLDETDVSEQTEALVEPVIENNTEKYLIYGVNDAPPIHITIICALQQSLLSLSGQLIVSLLVAEAVCASDNNVFKAKLLSSTLFMSGITTVAMNLFGIRLPLYQGASASYIIPLLLVANTDGNFCTSESENLLYNATDNTTSQDFPMEKILFNVRALQGSLMIAGVIHAFLGFTGIVGLLLKFVGPLTIVPALVLIFIFIVKPVLKFVEVHWGIAMSTVIVAVILFLYLSKYNMPVPIWTPSGGYRVIRYPVHQVFAILISICINWIICAILTKFDVIPNNPDNPGFNARTDARADIILNNPWVSVPYPGQYGAFGFSAAAFLSFMIATVMSILDSIGDYYACAKVARVPAPPKHAVNRGILIEGVCSFLSGSVGCGHATSTYGGNIGAIGVTKVASRRVFICTGIFYILFGIFGKFSAVFITIPYPVLGGAIVVMFGIFFGVVISNLEVTNMSSPRNMAIIGLSIFIGLAVPTWAQKESSPVSTGYEQFDKIMSMLLGNPNLTGTLIACFLDNTVPGSLEDRGIATWQVTDDDEDGVVDKTKYNEGYDVYTPLLPQRLLRSRIMRFIPFLPYRKTKLNHNGV